MTIHEVYEKYSNQKPVIDIGAGWWPVFDFSYTAFDKAQFIQGKKTCANCFGDFHDMSDFADNTFAFLSGKHVIEHAKDPKKALIEWTRILKIDGIMFLQWPGDLPKHSNEEIEKFNKWEEALKVNLEEYYKLGGESGWVSYDKNMKPFLDVHYSLMTMDEVKAIIPDSLKVVESWKCGDYFLILRKEN